MTDIGMFKGLREVLTSVLSPFPEESPSRQEAMVGERIDAPEVMGAIQELRAARVAQAGIAAEMQPAESALREAETELQRLRARVAERETALAKSDGPLPVEPFEEEPEIARVERQRRVLAARVELCRQRTRESQDVVNGLKGKLAAAWVQFCEGRYREVLARYQEAALAMRALYLELGAWRENVFGTAARCPSPGALVIENPSWQKATDRFLIHTDAMLNFRVGDVWASLQGLRADVERAKAGEQDQISTTPGDEGR